MKHASFFIAIGVVVSMALALRMPLLGIRPMHADEAVQAFRFRDLWEHGRYRYNPDEFHGPTLTYATYPFVWLSGAKRFADTTKVAFRVVPAVFGCLLVLLMVAFSSAFGKRAALGGALLAAVSPAFVFYSRYYIHEMLLTVFTIAAILSLQRYWCRGSLRFAVGLGVFIGLMQATKETAALSYLAAAAAFAVTGLWWWFAESSARGCAEHEPAAGGRRLHFNKTRVWHVAIAVGTSVAVAGLLLSSFGTNPAGLLDGVRTYLPWLRRAGGASPHIHPWYFYARRLLWWHPAHGWPWSEALIAVLGVFGMLTVIAGRGLRQSDPVKCWFGRWFGAYTVLLTVLYSAVPYKTPWCLLQFWSGWTVLAGVGAVSLTTGSRPRAVRWIAGICLLVGTLGLGVEAYHASYRRVADLRNPYVYAQTSFGVEKLTRQVEALAETAPAHQHMRVQVLWHDSYYWPMPWYLRRFDKTEFWQHVPEQADAPVIIASPKFDAALTKRLGQDYLMTGYHELRPRVLAQLWVRFDLWEAYLKRIGRL